MFVFKPRESIHLSLHAKNCLSVLWPITAFHPLQNVQTFSTGGSRRSRLKPPIVDFLPEI